MGPAKRLHRAAQVSNTAAHTAEHTGDFRCIGPPLLQYQLISLVLFHASQFTILICSSGHSLSAPVGTPYLM
jgi:hypothetical protein